MAKYTVYLTTTASASITVEVPDDLDEDKQREQAIEEAFQDRPGICAQCSGWGHTPKYSMDLGEWEVETGPDGNEIAPARVD